MNGYTVKIFDTKTHTTAEFSVHTLKSARNYYMKAIKKNYAVQIWKNGTAAKLMADSNPEIIKIIQ